MLYIESMDRPDFLEWDGVQRYEPRKATSSPIEHLGHLDSLRLHSKHVLEASNKIRADIDKGLWDNLTPRDWFFEIYNHHCGDSIIGQRRSPILHNQRRLDEEIYHTVALFEPTQLDRDQGEVQKNRLGEFLLERRAEKAWGFDQPQRGFGGTKLRQNEMEMVRGGGVMGVPKDILGKLEEKTFDAVSDFVNTQVKLDTWGEEDKRRIALTFAVLIDFFHFKPDLNGRTTEDWMVQLERVMFEGDMTKVRTWSHHGLRAKNVKNVIKPEFHDMVSTRDAGMDKRTKQMKNFRNRLYQGLTREYKQNGIINDNSELTDEILITHSDICLAYFSRMMEKLGQDPESFLRNEFIILGIDGVHEALVEASPEIGGSFYQYQFVDYYKSHTDSLEPFSRMQQFIQERYVKEETGLQRVEYLRKKISDLNQAGEIIGQLLDVIDSKADDYDLSKAGLADVRFLSRLVSFMRVGSLYWIDGDKEDGFYKRRNEFRQEFLDGDGMNADSPEKIRSVISLIRDTFPFFLAYLKDRPKDENMDYVELLIRHGGVLEVAPQTLEEVWHRYE